MENVPYLERVSFSPQRKQVNFEYTPSLWTGLQTTQYSNPLVFTGTERDLELLEACRTDGSSPVKEKLPYQIGEWNQCLEMTKLIAPCR